MPTSDPPTVECYLTTFTVGGVVVDRGHMLWRDAGEAFRYGRLVHGPRCGFEIEPCTSLLCPSHDRGRFREPFQGVRRG